MAMDRAKAWQRSFAVIADVTRLAALLSCFAAGLWWGPAEIARFVVVLGALLLPRKCDVPKAFDAAFCITVLLAAWSGVAGWYEAIPWWDIAVHLLTTGAGAAMAYLLLAYVQVVSPLRSKDVFRHGLRIIVLTFAFGLSAAAVWELWEWFGHNYLSGSIHVGYADTIGDMAAGGFGALGAGMCMAWWADVWQRRHSDPE